MNRVPGKYVVWVMGTMIAIAFLVMLVIAVGLGPAAERFKAKNPEATPSAP